MASSAFDTSASVHHAHMCVVQCFGLLFVNKVFENSSTSYVIVSSLTYLSLDLLSGVCVCDLNDLCGILTGVVGLLMRQNLHHVFLFKVLWQEGWRLWRRD